MGGKLAVGGASAGLTSVGVVTSAVLGPVVDCAATAVVVSVDSAVTPSAAGLGSGIDVAPTAAAVGWSAIAVSAPDIPPLDSWDPSGAGCSVAPQATANMIDNAKKPKKIMDRLNMDRVDMVFLKSLRESGRLAPKAILAQNSGIAKATVPHRTEVD